MTLKSLDGRGQDSGNPITCHDPRCQTRDSGSACSSWMEKTIPRPVSSRVSVFCAVVRVPAPFMVNLKTSVRQGLQARALGLAVEVQSPFHSCVTLDSDLTSQSSFLDLIWKGSRTSTCWLTDLVLENSSKKNFSTSPPYQTHTPSHSAFILPQCHPTSWPPNLMP